MSSDYSYNYYGNISYSLLSYSLLFILCLLCYLIFLHVFLLVILLEIDGKEETQSDTQTPIDNLLQNVKNEENSQENYISDHIHSQNSGEQLTINQDSNTLDNLETTKLDNSDTNFVTPEKDSHVKNVVTSTPNPKHRIRCESMDEPEFEEDKIFGKLGIKEKTNIVNMMLMYQLT